MDLSLRQGQGYPLPLPADEDELWKGQDESVKYMPLQSQEGVLAIVFAK